MQITLDEQSKQVQQDHDWTIFAEVVTNILNLGCGIILSAQLEGNSRLRRTVPSAGAIYPYEVFVAVRSKTNTLDIYLYDPAVAMLFLYKECGIEFSAIFKELEPNSETHPAVIDFAVFVANRPWKSVRKYGNRGVLYSLLDCAHATANVAFAATSVSRYEPIVYTQVNSGTLQDVLDTEKHCILANNMIIFPCLDQDVLRVGSSQIRACSRIPAIANATEVQLWLQLRRDGLLSQKTVEREITLFDGSDPGFANSGAIDRLERIDCQNCNEDQRSASFLADNRKRYSASSYNDAPLTLDQLKTTMFGCSRRLKRFVSKPIRHGVGLRIAVNNIVGVSGVYDYCFGKKQLALVSSILPNKDFRLACMNQQSVKNAAALIVLYGSMQEITSDTTLTALKEVVFSAGQVGQALYLSAAAADVGITAIGGFDIELCRQLVCLGYEHDPVYVFTIGNADMSVRKRDAGLQVRYQTSDVK